MAKAASVVLYWVPTRLSIYSVLVLSTMLDAVDRALGQIDSLIKGELEPVMKTLHTQQKGQP